MVFKNLIKTGPSILLDLAIPLSIIALIYFSSFYNYLLFHGISEGFAILTMIGIFMIGWNAKHFMKNKYFLFLGISFLFVSFIDFAHTLSYKGMGVFPYYNTNLPTQLWLTARYLQAISLLIAPVFIRKKLNYYIAFSAYAFITFLIIASTFYWRIFPTAYIEGVGLTTFKIVSEYIISFIFLLSIFYLIKERKNFNKNIFLFLITSISLTIVSEIMFTFYVGVYTFPNLLGHLIKILAFYFFYKAVIETGFAQPFNLLFLDLKKKEKELTLERDKVSRYVNLANVMFLVVGKDERVSFINKKGCEILGYKEKEIIGKNWHETYIPERERKKTNFVYKKLISGNIKPVEYFENPVLTKKGKERIIAWHNTVLKNEKGKIISILSSGEDVTERKELEKRKDEFISIASHELKTPVTSIKAFVQILERKFKDSKDFKSKYILSSLSSQTDKLINLISDLLDVGKIDEGKLQLKKDKFDLSLLIKKAIEDYSHIYNSHQILSEGRLERKINADQSRIEQVIYNLLNNAIKYSPNGSKVVVHLSNSNGRALVCIQDFGFGVSKKDQERIFERFYRSEDIEKNNLSGFGLGLYISNEIIKRHEGKMWMESQKGKGSKFFFTLPT